MSARERTVRFGVDLIAAVVCAIGASLALFAVDTPIRPAAVAIGLVVGTGWAATCWINLRDPAFAAGIAIATGLSLLFVISLLLVEIHWWHPIGVAGALLAAACLGNIAAAIRDRTPSKEVQ
jgi:hypothetical protein